jgi:hypothetical protein
MASAGFPKALSYSIKQMADYMTRVGTKLTPDRTTGIAPNDVITFKLPNNSLCDMRSLNFFYQFSTSGTTGTFIHPRYSSSLLERVSIVINGQTVDITPAYNLLYNSLMDLEGSSFDQLSKRNICEFFDPSVRIAKESDPSSSADVALSGGTWLTTGVTAPSKIEGAITHFLGFLGSCQPGVIDTSSLGDVFIQFQFATPYVLPANFNSTALSLAGASFTLDNIYATIDVISFSGNIYYSALASKLGSGGLDIGFYSYLNARFASFTKSSGCNVVWNISANSLDQLIATFQKTDANSKWEPMIAYGSQDAGSTVYTMSQIAANPTAYIGNTGAVTTRNVGLGDGFMNSYYFMRPGQALKEARWSINNRPLNYGYITPKEIFHQTMLALGYNSLDLGMNGVNFCIFSLRHFLKYYYTHIIDLTIQDSRDFWISGLNSLGSTISIQYEANFDGSSNSQTAIPVLYARLSKVLNVKDGRQISVL